MPKTILIAPLNWGLGHATRCIPIINAILQKEHKIILASDGVALELLKKEYPNLITESLPSYHIKYPENGHLIFQMAKQIPGIMKAIKLEQVALENLIAKYKIDVVISDNRYGMYNESVKSIYISHQLKVASPFGEDMLASLQSQFLKHFDEIWVPDVKGSVNLSGKLSHNSIATSTTKYIGSLSRFIDSKPGIKPQGVGDTPFLLAVISGPEPQRSVFEKMVIKEFSKLKTPSVIVGGNPNAENLHLPTQITYFNFLGASNLQWLLTHAKTIVTRSGYSTIMDLVGLKKQAVLIPTPGQTEQEYLAKHLSKSGLFFSMNQNEFNIELAIQGLEKLAVNTTFLSEEFNLDLTAIINTI